MSREQVMQPPPPLHSTLRLIGNPPISDLPLTETYRCQQFLTLECRKPEGSTQDRPARRMIAEAEQAGRLQPGGTIVEGTAGNTGLGFTLIARQKSALDTTSARSDLARMVGQNGYAVVTDDGRLVGVVPALDLLRDAGRTGVKEH